MSSLSDDGWSLLLDLEVETPTQDDRGLFLGNGKIGMITSFDSFDMDNCMITTQLKYNNGQYKSVMLEPFYMTNVRFFDNDPTLSSLSLKKQSLNMYSAIFKNGGTVTKNNSIESINIECDTYTPYQLPFSIVQSYTIIPNQDMLEFDFFHEPYAKETVIDVEFNNNVIFSQNFSPDQGVYLLSAKGRARVSGEQIAAGSVYIFETSDSPGTSYKNLGYNVYRNDNNRCYNKFRFSNMVANKTIKIHIVSAILTNSDFESPLEEVKRIVLNILNKGVGAQAVNNVRSEHVNQWVKNWTTNVRISPKPALPPYTGGKIKSLQRGITYSLYNIFSSLRENINLEVNPLNLSVIDYDGSVLYNGDIWLIPILLLLKPDMARALLEYRYYMISVARQLAAGYGYKGTKFPYTNDTVGYKNALYYDLSGPLSLFNTALISINVWNYFRVSRDRDWLISKGYTILKENADFFASRIEKDNGGTYHLRNVISLNDHESLDNNMFTVNLVKLALRFALEASYELTYYAKEIWTDSYYGLSFLYIIEPGGVISGKLLYDKDDTPNQKYKIVEPLMNLVPYYSFLFWQPELGHGPPNILDNINYYLNKIELGSELHPYNLASLAVCYGIYAQYDKTYTANYESTIYQLLDTYSKGVWKHLGFKGMHNDLTMNAILMFMILQGGSNLNIEGGVARTRFYYEEMRIQGLSSANLPNTWSRIRVTRIQEKLITSTTTNILPYP